MGAKPRFLWACTLVMLSSSSAEAAFDPEAYERMLGELESQRVELGRRFARAHAAERVAIRKEARRLVSTALVELILPAWMGTPWGLGPSSTSTRPHQPGMVVGCSYFVTGVLQNAGLRLESRTRFAQAPSALMQQALTPAAKDLHRLPGMDLARLERRIATIGDGVYIVGLNIHTGFLVVREGRVRVVHASYAPPNQVVDEPLGESAVIRYSRGRGYVVTPLFRDDRLVDFWLAGRPVPAPLWPRPGGRGQ